MIAGLGAGEVVSYGDVAHDAGRPGALPAVGALLASTDVELPWWRVVRSDGRLVAGDPRRQAALLRAEGVSGARRPGGARPRTVASPAIADRAYRTSGRPVGLDSSELVPTSRSRDPR